MATSLSLKLAACVVQRYRQHIAMREYDAFGLAGGAAGKLDEQRVVAVRRPHLTCFR